MDRIKKKVAVLLPSASVGGAERLIQEELTFLKNDPRLHIELHLVFEKGNIYEKFRELDIPVRVWNAPHKSPWMILQYLNLIRYLRSQGYDVLHVHLLNYLGPVVGRISGLKTITTVHSRVQYGFFEKICLSMNNILFACGKQVKNNLEGFIPDDKLRLLNNAVKLPSDHQIDKEKVLGRMGLSTDNTIVLTLGRLIRDKGYDLLVKSFEKVVEKRPDAVLLIGGEGPEKEALGRQIIENGMERHISLLGLTDNVDELLVISSIYVNSSRREGLPISLLEAMSYGKPVVAADVGGNRDLVKNGETGLLVSAERSDLLAEALLKLLEDEVMAGRLAKNALELVRNEYSIDKHCQILSHEYLN